MKVSHTIDIAAVEISVDGDEVRMAVDVVVSSVAVAEFDVESPIGEFEVSGNVEETMREVDVRGYGNEDETSVAVNVTKCGVEEGAVAKGGDETNAVSDVDTFTGTAGVSDETTEELVDDSGPGAVGSPDEVSNKVDSGGGTNGVEEGTKGETNRVDKVTVPGVL